VRAVRLAVLILAVSVTGSARAADATDAQRQRRAGELATAGRAAYEAGRWDEAIAAFKEAYGLSQAPGLLFNIAQAYRSAGDRLQALDYYRLYLERAPTAANAAEVRTRIAELERGDAMPAPVVVTAPPPQPPIDFGLDVPPATRDPDQLDRLLLPRRSMVGAILRADFDAPEFRGAALLTGVSVSFNERYEIHGGLLVGSTPGLQVGGALYFGRAWVRPFLAMAAPVFFADGINPGLAVGAGLRLDLGKSFAFRIEGAVTHFFDTPYHYRHTMAVPSVGVEAWL
jgi:tetratricopeptide (TPR) repeat protein